MNDNTGAEKSKHLAKVIPCIITRWLYEWFGQGLSETNALA